MTEGGDAHRLQVKVQDVVHVGWQGGEQGVVGPVETHLRDDDGPQRDGEHHWYDGNWPTVSLTLEFKVRSGYSGTLKRANRKHSESVFEEVKTEKKCDRNQFKKKVENILFGCLMATRI